MKFATSTILVLASLENVSGTETPMPSSSLAQYTGLFSSDLSSYTSDTDYSSYTSPIVYSSSYNYTTPTGDKETSSSTTMDVTICSDLVFGKKRFDSTWS